jgi:NAD(P)-dependent dehydrogenase (short-subunit alcohol dehydrogenase family)
VMGDGVGRRRFEGKVAVVAGASANPSIGRSCATKLGREGAKVVINARGEEGLRLAEKELAAEGIDVASVVGSMEDDGTAARLVEAAIANFGRIDLVVNTVGGAKFQGAPLTLDRESLIDTLALNTWTALSLIEEAMKAGLADGGGAVVNTSSGTVHKTTPSMASYAAGKAALNALTRTLARDLAAHGVRVNAVAPGLTQTSATRSLWEADDGAAAAANLLLGRLTHADDIANAALFLLSDEARQITGVTIDVDAGNHLMGGWSPFAPKPGAKPGATS